VDRFFDGRTLQRARKAIVRKYGATKVLVPRSHVALLPRLIRTFGAPVYRDVRFSIFDTRLKRDP
jgi:hypothetical protein